MRMVGGTPTGENSDDLRQWVNALKGCPPVSATALARCSNEAFHGDEPGTWFYLEGDAAEAIARRRCIGCGTVKHVLDSESRWNHPPMKTCPSCALSMFELAGGIHVEDGKATWLVLGARCVDCGRLDGFTDFVLPGVDPAEAVDAF